MTTVVRPEPIYRCGTCGQWLHFGVGCDLCEAVRDVERHELTLLDPGHDADCPRASDDPAGTPCTCEQVSA